MTIDRRLLAVSFAGFCAFLDLYATQPLLPMLARSFHASKLSVCLTVSATTLAVALSAPFVGAFADAVGRKRIIVPAIFALSLPTLLAATSPSIVALIGWRFAQGLCIPAIFAVTVAYVSEEWEGKGVGRAMSAYVSGSVMGGFAGRVLSAFIAESFGWRDAFVALAAVNLVCGFMTWRWLPSSRGFTRSIGIYATLGAASGHLRNPRLLVVYAVGFSVLFSLVGTFTYITFHLAGAPFHLGTVALGSIFFVYLLGVVVTPLAGVWLDRLGARTMLIAALLASMCGVLMTLSSSLWLVILGLAVCSSGVFVAQSAANSRIGEVAGQARALAVGFYVTSYYIGGAVGGVLPGAVWARGGWPACVALVAGVQLITAGFVAAFMAKRRIQVSVIAECA